MKRRNQLGTTLLEVTIGAGIAATMLGAGFVVTANMRSASEGQVKRQALSCHADEVLDRLAKELTVAGMSGEDANRNGVLDDGEDLDRNGRLDADWNLADGASTSDFSFNTRLADWTWSGQTRWFVVAGDLIRTERGNSVTMARNVKSFSVARTGDEVDLTLELEGKDGSGEIQAQSANRRIYVRN
jgi:hypothetical protein